MTVYPCVKGVTAVKLTLSELVQGSRNVTCAVYVDESKVTRPAVAVTVISAVPRSVKSVLYCTFSFPYKTLELSTTIAEAYFDGLTVIE